jgi:putative transposase
MSLWQSDFFSKRILTLNGIREVFVLAFIHVASRRVILSPATFQPNEAWVKDQMVGFVEEANSQEIPAGIVQHDRDAKFSKAVDQTLRSRGVTVKISEFRAPNTNAFVERFIQSIQQECLDRFVVFGSGHMDHLCGEYLEHYHTERPHQGIENEPVVKGTRGPLEETISLSEVRSSERLGGLLRSYWRKAG